MDITVDMVYKAALAIMDEEGGYDDRLMPVINSLIGRCRIYSEGYNGEMWTPVENKADIIAGVDGAICLSALPYGLAAMLYIDEDPVRSASWWSVFTEQLELFRRRPESFESIEDLYGGIEKGKGRW